jgi:hypothetical protein
MRVHIFKTVSFINRYNILCAVLRGKLGGVFLDWNWLEPTFAVAAEFLFPGMWVRGTGKRNIVELLVGSYLNRRAKFLSLLKQPCFFPGISGYLNDVR